jgi:catechol 2,3-dioxygenase-like lactoylglutathione lyase family enzyme
MDIPYHRSRVGLNHLAFHAESKEQVDWMTDQLKEKGIPILYQDRNPFAGGDSHYAVFFEDPDRIKVELVAPKFDKDPSGN